MRTKFYFSILMLFSALNSSSSEAASSVYHCLIRTSGEGDYSAIYGFSNGSYTLHESGTDVGAQYKTFLDPAQPTDGFFLVTEDNNQFWVPGLSRAHALEVLVPGQASFRILGNGGVGTFSYDRPPGLPDSGSQFDLRLARVRRTATAVRVPDDDALLDRYNRVLGTVLEVRFSNMARYPVHLSSFLRQENLNPACSRLSGIILPAAH